MDEEKTIIFDNPIVFAIERMADIYMISVEFRDAQPHTMEAPFVCGNIYINDGIKMGFDAPATFEIYYDCNITKVVATRWKDETIYLDIYVTT
jgi:hypothetical protein